jgi:outer membrane receptor protein involved in Fe transport
LPGTSRRDQGSISNTQIDFDERADSWAIGVNAQLEVDKRLLGHDNPARLRRRLAARALPAGERVPGHRLPPPSQGDKRTKRYLYGFFFQDDFSIREDLILSAGVRYDRNHREGTDLVEDPFNPTKPSQFETHDSEWSPRGALTWRPCEPFAVYASYAEGFRFPNLDEAFGAFGFAPLPARTSRSYEIGECTERTSLNVALYEMKVTNEIFLDIQARGPSRSART